MNIFQVKKAKHGKGAFAKKDIPCSEPIEQLSGPKITHAQLLRKRNTDMPLQISPTRYIDLRRPGLYFNHSCEPNCGVRSDLLIVAIKDIKKGEELTFDYSTTMDKDSRVSFICGCGAKSCRKLIDGFKTLPAKKKRYYEKKQVVQTFLLRGY